MSMSSAFELCPKEWSQTANSVNIWSGQLHKSRNGPCSELQWYDCLTKWKFWFCFCAGREIRDSYYFLGLTHQILMSGADRGHHSWCCDKKDMVVLWTISFTWQQNMVMLWPDDLESMCILRNLMNVCLVSCCWHILPFKEVTWSCTGNLFNSSVEEDLPAVWMHRSFTKLSDYIFVFNNSDFPHIFYDEYSLRNVAQT